MLAGSHEWLVYGLNDLNNSVEQPVDAIAIDAAGTATRLPLEFADYRTAVSLVGDLLTGLQVDIPDRVLWVDLDTGETGESELPPDSAYIGSSFDGWLALTPQGLVDISRSGDLRVIDPDPPQFGRYGVSEKGFIVTANNGVTYRSWDHLDVVHVFRPELHKDEALVCHDLTAKAIECSMDREYCPSWGCDAEPRVHHRPYYIPLEDGPPARSPLLGVLLGRTVTAGPFVDEAGRYFFRTWHAKTGKVTSARPPTQRSAGLAGRAWGRLILMHTNYYTGRDDKLIAVTPDFTTHEPVACSSGPCPVRRGG